jgi:beta-galactosidase
VLDLLHAGGIAVDLATATASPPPWLAARHPESLPVTRDGVRMSIGSRQAYCPSSPAYREAAVRMATAMAERYGAHPALALWHVNNEYGAHTPGLLLRGVRARLPPLAAGAATGTLDRPSTPRGARRSGASATGRGTRSSRRGGRRPRPTRQELDFRRFSSDALLACYDSSARCWPG